MDDTGTDTPLTFEQWTPIVHHVATKRFPWAAGSSSSREDKIRLRGLDREDLVQEGYIALLYALDNYKKDHVAHASFKTYAYKCIYSAMLKYTWANATPLKTWDKIEIRTRGSDAAKENLAAALRCAFFTDIAPDNPEFPDKQSGMHEAAVDNDEYATACIAKLREAMKKLDFEMLLDRASGMIYKDIGEKYGFSKQRARTIIKNLQYVAANILSQEIMDNG